MLERDTGRPRGFGFLTFSDRRSMEDAIREMNGSDFGERVISVNKAQPKMGGDDLDRGYGGSYPSGGSDRSTGHWARVCPSAGGQISSRSRFGGGREDRYADRVRYVDDRYDAGRFGDRDRYDNRDKTSMGAAAAMLMTGTHQHQHQHQQMDMGMLALAQGIVVERHVMKEEATATGTGPELVRTILLRPAPLPSTTEKVKY